MECLVVKYLFELFPTLANNNSSFPWWDPRRCLKDAGKYNVEEDEVEVTNNNNKEDLNANSNIINNAFKPPAPQNHRQQQQELIMKAPPALETKTCWRCDLCDMKVAREATLNGHLRGKNHRRTVLNQLWIVEASGDESELELVSPYVMRNCNGRWMCSLCDCSFWYNANVADHLVGQRHAANLLYY